MNIEAFVTESLGQITTAIKKAESDQFKFHVDSSDNEGIRFDLAVTTSSSESNDTGGKIGANIQIVQATLGTDSISKQLTENVSRIQFSIKCVPNRNQH